MEKRKLGFAGPEVPAICLGGNVYGWTLPEAESFRQLDAALNAGLNFVNTADSETIIGKCRWPFANANERAYLVN